MTEQVDTIETARRFAEALVMERFDEARNFLEQNLQNHYMADVLAKKMESLAPYAKSKADNVADPFSIGEEDILEQGDIDIVYVPISGEDFNEAVILTMAQDSNGVKIREIEWGRP